jgi:RHS repeat-associated protein
MNSLPGPYTQATLERLSDPHNVTVGFQRRLSDGSIEWFTQPGAMPGSTYAQWFLTMVVDPQGNAVTINYDSKLRITSLTSADGLSTTFSYDDLSTDASKLRVTKVTDPFGRSARFVYDSQGRLSSITDVLGIQSTYIYLPDTSCLPSNDQPSNDPVVGPDTTDFICALKTPYGTTKFSYTNDTAPPRAGSPSRRSVTIVDALGRTSRVEYRNKAPGIPDQDPSITVPGTRSSDATDGIATTNLYLSFRNTFIWDWYQYNQAGGDTAKQSDTLDYSKAKLIHWLHLDDNSNDRVMESSKEPLENRIWYDYAGQTLPYFRGTSNQPRHVGRVLPNGRTQLWTYAYNGFGHVTKATDPLGRQTTYVYDVNGVDLLSVSNTTPQCSSGTCSPASDLLATMTYNAQHGPLTVTGANGQTTHYTYNDRGQLATTTDALGHAWSNDYDVQGHLLGIYRPTPGRWWQSPQYIFSYDGRVTNRVVDIWYGPNTTDPSVTVTYDDADRVTSRKYLDGSSEQFGYTLLDLTSSTNRWGGITHLSYYPDRTVQYITDPSGNVSTYYYSPNGRVSDIWYPTTPCTGVGVCSGPDTIGFTRDLEGRVTATSYPDLTQNDIVYDAAGRIDHDSTRTFTYSDDGTVARIDYPAQSGLYQNFFYDSRYPRVTQISRGVPLKSWVDSTSHVYSPVTSPPTLGANRLSSVGTFSGVVAGLAPPLRASVSYVYDELDRVQTRTVWDGGPNGVPETFTYDEAGNVASVTNALDTFTYSYDELSRLTGIQSLHGPQGWVAYFPLTNGRRQEALGYMDSHGQYGVQFDYTYHANLITAFGLNYSNQLDPGGPSGESWWYYGYDGAKRLTGTNFVPPTGTSSQVTYTYDPHGNIAYITGVVRNGAANWGYYTPADQSSFMSYDSQGNPTALKYYGVLDIAGYSHGPEQYTWNAANQLTKVTTSAGESDFGYDQAGHLQVVTEQVAGTVVADRRYMWCGGTPCLEYDWLVGRGASKRYFAQGWVAGDGSKFYYIRDKLGSVRAVVDSNSRLRAKYDYDPYGLRIKVAGDVDSDIGFAGYFHHGRSGFDVTVNRGYDPRFGRWLNRDPIGIAGGLDLYRYADSDPVNLGDPSGLCPACVGAGVGFVAGGLFGAGLYAFTAPTSMSWGQFLSGAADAFQTGALAGALGGSGGAFLGTIAGGGTVAEALGWAMANGVDSNTNLAGEIFGDSSAGAGQLRILQTGGNTIKQATADALNASNGMNLSRREWGRALEALKTFLRLSNDFHGAIDSVGNLRDPATGEILGNMLEHCP